LRIDRGGWIGRIPYQSELRDYHRSRTWHRDGHRYRRSIAV